MPSNTYVLKKKNELLKSRTILSSMPGVQDACLTPRVKTLDIYPQKGCSLLFFGLSLFAGLLRKTFFVCRLASRFLYLPVSSSPTEIVW